ncbi:metal-dependent hydrolase [Methanobacterium sp.]|uniref:metal-dependent hydrolase n=1 Tax=Methanobacterium sp. TaxID=2164 RepID=UPI003C73D5BF
MPDWITHILIPWTFFTILGFKFKQFSQQNIAVVIMGALVPDIFKIYLVLNQIGIHVEDFFTPIHSPVGSILIASIISLFFIERRLIFIFLVLGISTHYALDLLLFNGGMYLLYPFNPVKWQIGIISVTDYNITIVSIVAALVVYSIYKTVNHRHNLAE